MKSFNLSLAALVMGMASQAAVAGDNGVGAFVGADFGAFTQHKISASGYEDESDMGTSYSIYAGYQFHPNWAAKLSIVDLGTAKPIDESGVSLETEADGNTLTAVWSSERLVKGWSIYAELGLLQWDASMTVAVNGFGSASASDSGTSFIGGLGGSYAITEKLDITLFALWSATETDLPIDETTTLDFQYSRYGAGLQYRF